MDRTHPAFKYIWFLILALAVLTVTVLSPFLFALTLGTMLAVALAPWKTALCSRLHLRSTWAAGIIVMIFTLTILGPLALVLYRSMTLVTERLSDPQSLSSLQDIPQQLAAFINRYTEVNVDAERLKNLVVQMLPNLQNSILQIARSILTQIPDATVQILILLITLFVVLRRQEALLDKIVTTPLLPPKIAKRLLEILVAVCREVVFANVLTAVLQASMVTAGSAIFTKFDPFIIFIVTFITSFIPVIGAAPIAIVLSVTEAFNQHYGSALALLGLSIIVGFSDNVLRAWLLTQQRQGSSFLNLLAGIGGIYLWGIPGLFMGPLVMNLSIRAIPLLIKQVEPITRDRGTKKATVQPAISPSPPPPPLH